MIKPGTPEWQELAESVKKHEGLRLKPYHDTVGKLTIGYGRNLDDVGITLREAEEMLLHDLSRCRDNLYISARKDAFIQAPVQVQQVLIELAYNLGIAGLLKFRRMWAALEAKDYETAADEMLDSKWAAQVKGRATTLADKVRSCK